MPEVPNELKQNIWALYELATAGDPAIAAQYVVRLISHLQIAMKISEVKEYDSLLIRNMLLARRAWFEYSESRNPGLAMQTTTVVTTEVGHLVYDKRFSVAKQSAFATSVR
jgi:hypothetical protein